MLFCAYYWILIHYQYFSVHFVYFSYLQNSLLLGTRDHSHEDNGRSSYHRPPRPDSNHSPGYSLLHKYRHDILWNLNLTLKAPITTAADDIHKYFVLFFRENKTWCFKWILSRGFTWKIKLYFLRKKSKKLKCRLLQFLFGVLRVNIDTEDPSQEEE